MSIMRPVLTWCAIMLFAASYVPGQDKRVSRGAPSAELFKAVMKEYQDAMQARSRAVGGRISRRQSTDGNEKGFQIRVTRPFPFDVFLTSALSGDRRTKTLEGPEAIDARSR